MIVKSNIQIGRPLHYFMQATQFSKSYKLDCWSSFFPFQSHICQQLKMVKHINDNNIQASGNFKCWTWSFQYFIIWLVNIPFPQLNKCWYIMKSLFQIQMWLPDASWYYQNSILHTNTLRQIYFEINITCVYYSCVYLFNIC